MARGARGAARVPSLANLTEFLAKQTDGSIGNLKRDVPRKNVGLGGVLESAACRQQQMVVFIEVVDRPDIESGAVPTAGFVGGLMEQFSTYDQFVGHLPLQKPAKEPKVLVIRAAVVVDPVSSAAIRRPIAEALLHPKWKVHADVACPQASDLISCWEFDKGKNTDLRTRSVLVFLDETIFEPKLGVAVPELPRPAGGIVEGQRRDDVQLTIGNEAIVVFESRSSA
jgi:hypothetical protein